MLGKCSKSPNGQHVEIILRDEKLCQYGICKYCQQKAQSYHRNNIVIWNTSLKTDQTTIDKKRIYLIWRKNHKPITRADF